MEWKRSDNESSENEENFLRKSKSDSSIMSIINYGTESIQIPLVDSKPRIDSNIDNFARVNISDSDEMDETIEPNPTYVINDPNLAKYGFETVDKTTKQAVFFRLHILNFQGIQHYPDEIASHWKKDCRSWLWKSVRHARKQQNLAINATMAPK